MIDSEVGLTTIRIPPGPTSRVLDGDTKTSSTLIVRALGSLSVSANGVEQHIGKPQARSVLAFLLMHLGEVVPADVIIDELWDGEPPTSAHHGLHVAISTLRRVLEPDRNGEPSCRLVTERPGYTLSLLDDQFDVLMARRLTVRGRQLLANADFRSAEECLVEAEQLFRGPPYAEFTFADFAQPEIRRLCELRLGLTEDRIDAQLLRGKHHELVPELEYLALSHPSRERFIHQLMIALVRSDRRADALKAYGEASRRLWVDFGVTPGHCLSQLAADIRHMDAGLGSSTR